MAYSKIAKRSDREWKAFKNYLGQPVQAVKDWFGVTPDDWQGYALNDVFGKEHRTAIKSAHGVGKTAFDSWVGWIFLNCYEDSRVVATAPTQAQLQDALFSEFSLWHSKMPEKMQNEWVISATHIRHKSNPNVWFAVARTSNKPANLQGFHNKSILIEADEASGIPEPVFEVMEGTLSEADDDPAGDRVAKLVMNGNPNFTSGEMFNAFGKNKAMYNRITVTGDPELCDRLGIKSGEYHPEHGVVFYSPRVRAKYVSNMASKYGRDSAVFDVRVRGIFPRFSDECVFPWENTHRAMELDLPPFDKIAHDVTLVVDVARGGFAETVIGRFRCGLAYKIDGYKTTSTTQTVMQVQAAIMELISQGLRLKTIIVDEPGVGGGVIDQLRAAGLSVTPYNGSIPMKADLDPAEDCRLFKNRRARDHWRVRLRLEQGTLPLPYDETLLAQMTSLHYKYDKASEKIVIESKQDLKDRLGKDASPDRSDVIVMGTAPWYEPSAVAGIVQADDWTAGSDRPQMEMDL